MDDYLVALGPFSSDLTEWLQIWAKPLCKSASLLHNQPQPPSLTMSSNHSALANNALQNQHQVEQETKEVRYHREQERHELRGILSAPFPICIQHDASSKATANYFGQIC